SFKNTAIVARPRYSTHSSKRATKIRADHWPGYYRDDIGTVRTSSRTILDALLAKLYKRCPRRPIPPSYRTTCYVTALYPPNCDWLFVPGMATGINLRYSAGLVWPGRFPGLGHV